MLYNKKLSKKVQDLIRSFIRRLIKEELVSKNLYKFINIYGLATTSRYNKSLSLSCSAKRSCNFYFYKYCNFQKLTYKEQS